jgi:hypothetical protein
MPLRDENENTTLAKKPVYGENDPAAEREEVNKLDLTKGTADDLMEDRDQDIRGEKDTPGDDED